MDRIVTTTALILRLIPRIRVGVLAVALALTVGLNVAAAAPVTYSFSTGSAPFAVPELAGLFGPGDFVSGTFIYDAAAPFFHAGPEGSSVYGFTSLSGSVAGLSFSDTNGWVGVGNDLPISVFPAADFIQLGADPPQGNNLAGFTIGGYTLVNVRMFWIEGQLGITDFLNDQNLPATLPSFEGRLVLDFVPSDNLSGSPVGVAFDGLRVQASAAPVPVPAGLLLLAPGLAGLAMVRRRLRR